MDSRLETSDSGVAPRFFRLHQFGVKMRPQSIVIERHISGFLPDLLSEDIGALVGVNINILGDAIRSIGS